MMRIVTGLFVLSLCIVGVTKASADDPPQKKQRDPAALFKKLDTNNDGKLSKDEFMVIAERIKAKAGEEKGAKIAQVLEKVFTKLDKNKDGYLTPEEFKEFKGLGGGNGAFKKKKNGNNNN